MNNKFVLLVLLISFNLRAAEDAGQLVMDAISNRAELEASIKNIEDEDDDDTRAFLPDKIDAAKVITAPDGSTEFFLSQDNPEITQPTQKDIALESGQRIIGDKTLSTDTLIEARDREIFLSVANKKESSFSFYYIKDDYTVTDSRGIYKQTYIDDQSAVRGGSLMFSWERSLINSWVNVLWGANFGVGLSQGNGSFVDGERSDTEFSLWTLPVEVGIVFELPVSTWFTLSAEAGPSAMGLYQVRSDFETGAAGKRRRQIGTGYYAEAKFKLSLSNIFSHTAFNYFSEYGVSNTSLDIIARLQDYGNFQDDITITGQSLGIGFSFDYL